jgi:hypothetical protein
LTHPSQKLYGGYVSITKSNGSNGLSDAGAVNRYGFDFAVKVDFKGEGRSIENGAAIRAVTQVALDFTRNFRRQPAFQVFAD